MQLLHEFSNLFTLPLLQLIWDYLPLDHNTISSTCYEKCKVSGNWYACHRSAMALNPLIVIKIFWIHFPSINVSMIITSNLMLAIRTFLYCTQKFRHFISKYAHPFYFLDLLVVCQHLPIIYYYYLRLSIATFNF